MSDNFLIPFDEGTDVLVHEPSLIEPVRPPSLPRHTSVSDYVAPIEASPAPEVRATKEPREWNTDPISTWLGPAVALLTALVVYRLFF